MSERSATFYCAELAAGTDRIRLPTSEARHAVQSLRLHSGDAVRLIDGRGNVVFGALEVRQPTAGSKRNPATWVRPQKRIEVPPPARLLTLIVAGCKGPRLDWMIEKCTELGVDRIVLADFERSVVRVPESRLPKLQRTAIEACKQCGRAWLPQITTGASSVEAVRAVEADAVLIAHPTDDAHPAHAALNEVVQRGQSAAVVVGPEGGLTDSELEQLTGLGGRPVRLSKHVLRVETAAVCIAGCWAALGAASRRLPTRS